MKYTIRKEDYNGRDLIAVYELKGITSEGEQILSDRPIIKFGAKKAKAIIDNIDAIREFFKMPKED